MGALISIMMASFRDVHPVFTGMNLCSLMVVVRRVRTTLDLGASPRVTRRLHSGADPGWHTVRVDQPSTARAATSSRSSPYDHLASIDLAFGELIARYGRPDPFHWGWAADRPDASAFRVLLLQIVSQHVPVERSFLLFDRLERAAGGIDPARILGLAAAGLASVGLPTRKAASALAVAKAVTDGVLDLDDLPPDDDEAMRSLTALPGIGPWSAEMFLLGHSHRPDVLPSGDFGIRRAVGIGWHLDAVPSASQTARRGAAWSPYRSHAAALLWASVLSNDARSGPAPGSGTWRGKRAALDAR
jgi:DNA-3-methyladenine glycosylase II